MPLVGDRKVWGVLGGVQHLLKTPWYDTGAGWVQPKRVWNGQKVVWAKEPTAPTGATAVLEGDGTVTITWTPGTPEVVTSYEVRRSDGTLVAAVGLGVDEAVDGTPLDGSHAYSVIPLLGTIAGDPVLTNTVGVDLTPDTFTVTFDSDPAPNRSAVLAWTGEKGGTTQIKIYRGNGTLVGSVGPGVLTLNDNSPASGAAQQYRLDVVGLSGTGVAATMNADPVDIALPAVAEPFGDDDSDLTLVLNWDPAGVGEHTGFDVVEDGVVVATVAEGAATYTRTLPASAAGSERVYTLRTKINGNQSAAVALGTASFTPNVPSAVAINRTAVVNQLVLTWGAPSVGTFGAYEVQADESEGLDGTWVTQPDSTSPSAYTWSVLGGDRQMRVRTIGQGGEVSAWVALALEPTQDNEPPAEPTMTSFKPEASYGRLVARFTTAASDNDQYQVQRRTNGGAWTTVVNWTDVGDSVPVTTVVVTGTSGNLYEVRVNVRDRFLNTREGTPVGYTLKPAAQTVLATATSHYRQSTWDWAGNGKAYQGYFSNPSFNYLGFFFYGPTAVEDACSADSDLGGTLTVTSMQVRLLRDTAIGSFSVDVWLGTTTTTSEVGVPTVENVSDMGALLNQGDPLSFTLTSAQRTALVNGTARSLGLSRATAAAYMAVEALADDALSGRLTINSLG